MNRYSRIFKTDVCVFLVNPRTLRNLYFFQISDLFNCFIIFVATAGENLNHIRQELMFSILLTEKYFKAALLLSGLKIYVLLRRWIRNVFDRVGKSKNNKENIRNSRGNFKPYIYRNNCVRSSRNNVYIYSWKSLAKYYT